MSSRKRNRHLNELPTHIGQFETKTHIQVIQYNSHNFSKKKTNDITKIQSSITSDSVMCIRVFGMADSNKK